MSVAALLPRDDQRTHATNGGGVRTVMTEHSAPRTYGIDALRGVACLSVLLFHYLSRGPRAGWMVSAPWSTLEPIARYGYLGVHLFFMVSGYVIFMSAIGRSPREFVASRVARLYPALWCGATLTMLLVVARSDARFLVSWREYAWNLTLIPQFVGARFVDGAYWSLAVELQFYIMVWIALRTGLIARVELLLWAWLLLAIFDFARPTYTIERVLIANWAPLFVLGATAFLITARGWNTHRSALLVAAGALALLFVRREALHLAVEWQGVGPDAVIAMVLVIAAALVFVAFGTGVFAMRKSLWATVPGALTYPVYLVHQVGGYVMYGILLEMTLSPRLALITTIAFAIATGALLHYGVERRLGPIIRRGVSARTRRPLPSPSP